MKADHEEPALPGEELVRQGLRDLAGGRTSEPALLVLIASPRLKRLGIHVPAKAGPAGQTAEHELYERLEQRLGTAAHSRYNSLIRRIVSYARALEREASPF